MNIYHLDASHRMSLYCDSMALRIVRKGTRSVTTASVESIWDKWRKWWSGHDTGTKAGIISALVAIVTLLGGLIGTMGGRLPGREPPVASHSPQSGSGAGMPMPLPTCATCTTGKTFPEQVSSAGTGATTFRDPRAFRGRGKRVKPGEKVAVVCRFLDPNAPLSVQPGWWYLLASSPWNRQYYSPANSYLNGDPINGPHLADVDSGAPVC